MVTWDSIVTEQEYVELTTAKRFIIDYYTKIEVLVPVVKIKEWYMGKKELQLLSKHDVASDEDDLCSK